MRNSYTNTQALEYTGLPRARLRYLTTQLGLQLRLGANRGWRYAQDQLDMVREADALLKLSPDMSWEKIKAHLQPIYQMPSDRFDLSQPQLAIPSRPGNLSSPPVDFDALPVVDPLEQIRAFELDKPEPSNGHAVPPDPDYQVTIHLTCETTVLKRIPVTKLPELLKVLENLSA